MTGRAGERPIAVITGAAGGIGRAVARRLGARYRLALVDFDESRVCALRAALEDEGYELALALPADVSSASGVADVARAVEAAGTLGTLVHAAGVSPSLADWSTILRVNLTGTSHVLDAFLPLAVPGSSAVCLASTAAYTFVTTREIDAVLDAPASDDLTDRLIPLLRPDDGDMSEYTIARHAYGASKWGVIRMVESRVESWAQRGARIVSISPGVIVTPMSRSETAANPAAARVIEVTPLRRWGTPADIAAAVDFLSSDLASFITGADLRIDGGIIAAGVRLAAPDQG